MDASRQQPAPTDPPLFTKRERYAIAALTFSFMVVSALVHVVIGSVGSGLFPHFQHAAAAPIQPISIYPMAKETPTPAPVLTPKPIVTAVPQAQRTSAPQARPPVRPKRPPSTGHPSTHPSRTDIAMPTGPPTISPPAPLPTAQSTASPEPPSGPQQIIESDFIRKVTPDYPDIARDENVQGSVTVRVTIGPDGAVVAAVVVESSGNAQLDGAALRAARESVYRAPMLDGAPTTRDYLIVYTFSLDT